VFTLKGVAELPFKNRQTLRGLETSVSQHKSYLSGTKKDIKRLKARNYQKVIISKINSTVTCNLILIWAIADERAAMNGMHYSTLMHPPHQYSTLTRMILNSLRVELLHRLC
jgi:hypothetical protein